MTDYFNLEKDGDNNFRGQLVYEGQYLNGERNGFGKEYDEKNGKLIFEGQYLNGKNGMGILKNMILMEIYYFLTGII